uniref:Nudix hydrolase domain-containing protein n=1 Tax=Plectus sambesii TaxID=2011161 RepID=A0A914W6S8_9BILA
MPKPLSFEGLHKTCRDTSKPYLHTKDVHRTEVPDEKVPWSASFPDYKPKDYTDPKSKGKDWADPDIDDSDFHPKWNSIDGKIDRKSHIGEYDIVDGRPQNPLGRTGLKGRGTLGKWGPNHAADPIVTRWKRDDNDKKVTSEASGKPILQFVAILRGDVKQWAIPGGMVDPGEAVSATLRREFSEEAANSIKKTPEQRKELEKSIETLFQHGTEVYKGYVDDPRNTDNSWMETVAVNFHDENDSTVGGLELEAGDDASDVHWKDIASEMELYASHVSMLKTVGELHNAHW